MIYTHRHVSIILKIVEINSTCIKDIYFSGCNELVFVNFSLNIFLEEFRFPFQSSFYRKFWLPGARRFVYHFHFLAVATGNVDVREFWSNGTLHTLF